MKCHYIYVEGVGKVFIPGCWAGVMHGDASACTCTSPTSEAGFQREEFNAVIREKNTIIAELEEENKWLNREMKKLLKARKTK